MLVKEIVVIPEVAQDGHQGRVRLYKSGFRIADEYYSFTSGQPGEVVLVAAPDLDADKADVLFYSDTFPYNLIILADGKEFKFRKESQSTQEYIGVPLKSTPVLPWVAAGVGLLALIGLAKKKR